MQKEYRVHGCVYHGNYLEGLVNDDMADFWGVYEVQEDGTESWIADSLIWMTLKCLLWKKKKSRTTEMNVITVSIVEPAKTVFQIRIKQIIILRNMKAMLMETAGITKRRFEMAVEYVIKKGDDFHGVPYDVLTDGIVRWSGKTRSDYKTDEYEILSEEVFKEKIKMFCDQFCGKWKETDEQRYNDMLDVLPPLKWTSGGFFISEAYSLNIHPFHQKWFGRHFEAYFRIDTPREEILKSL